MENKVDASHGAGETSLVAHIADIEFELRRIIPSPHVVLFLLVAAEDADFTNTRFEEARENRVAK